MAKIKDRVSVVAQFVDVEKTIVLEVIALREVIHQGVVPAIEDAFPGAFVTMEAVCAFSVTRKSGPHQLYGGL